MARALIITLVAALVASSGAMAQDSYPARAITLVSAYPPGGAADLTARPLAPALERALMQSVVVVNKIGAGGAVGTHWVTVQPADGYTVLLTVFSISTIPEADRVNGRTPTFTRDQFIPVARLNADPTVIVVGAGQPWKSIKELVADANKRPNDILFSSAGFYTVGHMSTEIFMQAAGIKMRHLPTTGGGPALTAVLGGHAALSAISTGAATPQVKAGKLRILASTGARRLPSFPDTPTLKELGYDAEVYLWTGIFVRKEVPADIVKTLRGAIAKAVQDSEFIGASTKMQMPPAYLDADEFKSFWDKDTEMLVAAIGRMPKPDPKPAAK
jgi:tripartite-type tricarboxylate transporter receptor subunit TctC